MQELSEKKIKIIPRSGQNDSGSWAPKKGFTFFGLFSSPNVETRVKNTTTVLTEPVLKSPSPHVPHADPTSVKEWVALEEKIVHDYKEQKTALSKSAVFLPKTPEKRPLPGSSGLSKQEKKASLSLAAQKGFTFFGLFSSPRAEIRVKKITTISKNPVLKKPLPHVPQVDPTVVKNWVALEEKIVHDYKEQKTTQAKSTDSSPKVPSKQLLPGPSNLSKQEKKVFSPLVVKKRFALFGLFSSPKAETCKKNTSPVLKEPVLKNSSLNAPRANLAAIKNWVALEEKIVDSSKEQKTFPSKSADFSPKGPAKQSLPVFETFTTRTAVSLPAGVPKPQDSLRGSKRAFSGIARFLLACGFLMAGAFVLLHAQEIFSNRVTSQELARLQSEKKQLEQSYAALKSASEDQNVEMKWLNGRLRSLAGELKTAEADKVAFEQGLEKKYREELMRITIRYESELAALRGTVQTQNAIVRALKAQSQAFDKIVDQAGLSALSGAAAGFSQGPFSTGGIPAPQGVVTSVNERQGFVVISMGAAQGARSGRWITISRGGTELAAGRIDRVYPSMSAVMVRDTGMLQMIQEGDSVSFS